MLYLIDASIYVFRAWFSIPSSVTGKNQQPVNAAYGFARFLTEFLEQTRPEQVVIAFDESLTRSFRNELYPPYKMNRELPPAELKQQFVICRQIAEAMGLQCVASSRYEADDLIGTFATAAQLRGEQVTIVSADKDLAQLLSTDDVLWDFARRKKYTQPDIQEKFGVRSDQIADFLGLCGDAVDNIPGIPGVGAKTAAVILQQYASLDDIYANLNNLAELPVRGAKKLAEKFIAHEEQARLSKQLATIDVQAPVACSPEDTKRQAVCENSLSQLSDDLGGRALGLFERASLTYA